ncbi:uncharacterized protein LOC136760434 [Amia ocellicauda]|uniref:uncharacterized protein LOC136760434 n=1 Tax=Amia ocellicauda TaxID=2972642 RepID=UPI003463FDD5
MKETWLYGCLSLFAVCFTGVLNVDLEIDRDWDWDWGSGLHEFLHSFPADSPFVTETPGTAVNCSQRIWLPPSSPICWENIAGPEEFEQTRLLVLQNRAALRAVTEGSGVGERGPSYNQQAKDEVQGIRDNHLNIVQTAETIQKVFQGLEEKRKESTEPSAFSSLKQRISTTKDSIQGREHLADLLERQLARLEGSLHILQLRLGKLLAR